MAVMIPPVAEEVGYRHLLSTPRVRRPAILTTRQHPELAAAVAQRFGIELTPTRIEDFSNGEIYVDIQESIREHYTYVFSSMFTSSLMDVNKAIMETAVLAPYLLVRRRLRRSRRQFERVTA